MRRALLLMVSLSVMIAAGQALGGAIGHYDTSKEDWGLSTGYIPEARADLIGFGNTLVSTPTMTASFLSGVDAVYVGLLGADTTAAEQTALTNFVNAGGLLVIQTDWAVAAWTPRANALLGLFGANATGDDFLNNVVASSSTHRIATTPNDIRGQTFTGAAQSWYDVYTGFSVIATVSGDTNRPTVIAKSVGLGEVVSTSDINFFTSPAYSSTNTNGMLWENIWGREPQGIIPEPSTLAIWSLLGAVGICVGWWRRKR